MSQQRVADVTVEVATHPARSDCGVGVGPLSEYTPRLEMPLVPRLADSPAPLSL